MQNSQLEKYEEKQVAKVSKLQKKAEALKVSALKIEVNDDKGIVKARTLIKDINAYKKEVSAMRTELTAPLDDVKKQLIAKEKEVLKPLEEAKANLGDKVIAYEKELEAARQAELQRVDLIIDKFSDIVTTPVIKDVADVETRGKAIKAYYSSLDKKDQGLASVKLALTTAVNKLTDLKDSFLQREASAKEQAEREKATAKAELEAKKEEVKDARATSARPKSGMVTLTKFEITDANAVPRSLCSPDEGKIRESIKEGATDIPGVRIYTETKVR